MDEFQAESGEVEEHRLEWMVLHSQYKVLFDTQVSELLSREGLLAEEFAHICAAIAGGAHDGGPLASFLDVVTASEDYHAFVDMMRGGRAPWADPEDARAKMLTRLISALDEPRFVNCVVAFVLEHHAAFKVVHDNGADHCLEWTSIHNTYQAMYEAHIAEALAREGFHVSDLIGLVKTVRSTCSLEVGDALDSNLELFTQSEDYVSFVDMMQRVVVDDETVSLPFVVATSTEPVSTSAASELSTSAATGPAANTAQGSSPENSAGGAADAKPLYERRVLPPGGRLPALFSLLPEGWRSRETSEGRVYYEHVATGESQWDRPV